jgi:hypothetical protein
MVTRKENRSSIQVSKDLREKLAENIKYKNESYEDIIWRLLNNQKIPKTKSIK